MFVYLSFQCNREREERKKVRQNFYHKRDDEKRIENRGCERKRLRGKRREKLKGGRVLAEGRVVAYELLSSGLR